MAERAGSARKSPLGGLLRRVGAMTASDGLSGQAFRASESLMTSLATWLSGNEIFLNQVGKAMERSFMMKAQANRYLELYLRTLRMPTSTDVDDLREQIRRMHDQVEALGSQFETVVEGIEALKQAGPASGTRRTSIPSSEE